MTHAKTRRAGRYRPPPGSSRWFRRYRVLVVLGWIVILPAIAWMLLAGEDRAPVAPLTQKVEVPAARWGPAAQPAGEALAVKLPADDAPHEKITEWWYYSGHLLAESGERYSFHIAAFVRQGALSHTAFHGSLLDHKTGRHYTEQARTEGNPSHGSRDGFEFSFGSWWMQGNGPKHSAKMAGKNFVLDLRLDDKLAPLLHQAPGTPVAGLLDFGATGTSYYTSRPRMQAEGSVTIDGVPKAVRGEVWFDHQWGDFEASRLRWNWFALQLADGADLMIYELFDRQGTALLRMGTYASGGRVTALGETDFKASAQGFWKSPSSGVVYPMDWRIAVPGKGVNVKLEPVIRHSQFNARATTLNVYWEGAVTLSGSQAGLGFMELSGYEPMAKVEKKR